MRKLTAAVLVCLASALIADTQLDAQNYVYATGNPPLSTQIPIENGFINVNNAEIHIEIPLAQDTQRGKLQLSERLVYDSRIWKIVYNSGYSWQPTNVPNSMGGWRFVSGAETGTGVGYQIHSGTVTCTGGGQWGYYAYWGFNWTDPQGTNHLFNAPSTVQYTGGSPQCTNPPASTSTSSGSATDGSGYTVQITNFTQATIFDKQGNQYNVSGGSPAVQDPNGNYWSTDGSGNLIDTLGRTPVLVSTSGNNIYYDVLTYGGGRSRYTVTTETVNYHTAFGQSAVSEAIGSFTAIQNIQLPDGSNYSFTYDSGTASGNYGELTSVTLPQGGVIQYTYTNFLDSFQNQNRWLNTRVKDGGTTTFTPTTISNCTSSSGCQEKTTVTSPTNNDTVYTFTLDQGSYLNASSWVTGIDIYQGSSTGGGTKLRSSNTSYTYSSGVYGYPSSSGSGTTVAGTFETPTGMTVTTTLPSVNLTSQVQTALDSLGNPTAVKEWDYYSGAAPSNPTRETDYTYYYSVNGGELPTLLNVKDGSGNLASETTYGYDETTGTGHAALVTTSGLSNHNSVSGNRGNLTTVSQWINSSGSTLNTEATYDDAGTLLTQTDPNGTATFGHDSTDTFVTSTTPPTPSSGVSLANSATYDSSTGLLTSATDPNGTETLYQNYDAFGRVGQIEAQSGGSQLRQTNLGYSSTQSSVYQHQDATHTMDTETLFDGYGRQSRVANANGQSSNPWYQQDTCYDTNGNISFQAYSYQGNGWGTTKVCSGNGDSYTYDALGRVTSITHADGSSIQYSYTGRATKVTDENGVSRIMQSDGLGRTTAICEISSNTLQGDSPSACGLDISGTGYLTSYSYDLANHKTTVTQGVQQRIFQTDWLGRTIQTQEPERGTTTYSYSYSTSPVVGLTVTRQRPQANQTGGTLTTTTTQYDSLGRVVSINYTDGTPTKAFTYDVSSLSAFTLQNPKGRMVQQMSGTNAGAIYSHDPLGRVIWINECTPWKCGASGYTSSYSYDWLGNVLTAGNGDGVTTSYSSYSPANEVGSITSSLSGATYPSNLVSQMAYGPNGPLSYMLGNGLETSFSYDALGRRQGGWLCQGSTQNSCSGGTQVYGYYATWTGTYLTGLSDTVLNRGTSYGYDQLGRLASSTVNYGTQQNFSYLYDRYGNRWQQSVTAGASGPQPSFSFDKTSNRITGQSCGTPQPPYYCYDAAGNLTSDSYYSYSYDAEGNVTKVNGGSTATYTYDALNQRIRIDQAGGGSEFVLNPKGQRVSYWNPVGGYETQGQAYWGSMPIEFYEAGAAHFQHQDYLGTERMRTTYNGAVEGSFTSLPFGDGSSYSGSDNDPYHFAILDHDYNSNTEHAQFRQYSNEEGRWHSPDPYDGSYDFSDPQSFNRYSYVLNNPLSMTDPTGQGPEGAAGCLGGPVGCAVGFAAAAIFDDWLFNSLFGGPSFHGSLKPRPNSQPWDEHNIHYGPNIAGALGLPDAGCDFGACGGGIDYFQQNSGWEIDKRPLKNLGEFADLAGLFHYYFYNPGTHEAAGLGPDGGIGGGLFCSVPGKWETGEQQGTMYQQIPDWAQSCVDKTIRNDLKTKSPNYFFWDSFGETGGGMNCHGYVVNVLSRCQTAH